MAITPITKKRVLYTDFDKELTRHPVSSDVSRIINEEAIKESIKNLVLTDRGERPFQPDIGCDVRQMLFENIDGDTVNNIKDLIINTISTYEPRCNLIGVNVSGRTDSNSLDVSITFNVINSETPVRLDLVLNRVR